MDKMKSFRPLKSPPRPESIKILSPFGEKLLMILRENRLRDNTISYHGNSQINTRRGFGNDDIMQQLKRWDDGNPNKQLNFTRKNSTSVPPFSKILEAKSTADSLVNATGRFKSRLDSTGPTDRPNSTGAMNSYINRPSNVLQQSCPVGSTQNRINLKRTSILAEELGNKKKICNKFQVPLLRQTQLKNNIPKRNFQQNNFLQRIGNKATEKRLGVMEIELGKPCSVKKTTQKTIGDFFAAPSTDKNNNSEEDDSEEESVWQTKLTQLDQTTMKISKHSSPRFVSSIINSNDNDYKSEESFFTTIDDLIGVKNNLNAGDEEDNYTVDMFADEEMKNTRTIESNGTGIEKIRNKLMKFRRSDDNDV
ncbi:hypothetical protein LSTR_LSTR014378 [Laodelphax striatellus]|uniref:Uncharacterized protein n=1 Tax=Laodelphax striatellus TaxID=195883 RepID=A0A482XNL4_LAOST|nr:hypothetical protein LSTR_LSTR014378 [Laodelphax striatellus]